MATRYAMLDRDGKVRRVTYDFKPHPDALEVVYPTDYLDSIDRVVYRVRQKPKEEWEVDKENGKVTITYEVTERDLDELKERKLERARNKRKRIEADGTYFEHDGEQLRVRTDSQTQAKLSATKDYLEDQEEGTEVDWETCPREWTKIDMDRLKVLQNAIGDHVQKAFSRQREIQEAVEAADDHHELDAIDISTGWPETAGISELENES